MSSGQWNAVPPPVMGHSITVVGWPEFRSDFLQLNLLAGDLIIKFGGFVREQHFRAGAGAGAVISPPTNTVHTLGLFCHKFLSSPHPKSIDGATLEWTLRDVAFFI